MRAYYYDNLDGHPTLPHDSGHSVAASVLASMGVLHWLIPVDNQGEWEQEIDAVAREREYKNRDVIESSRKTLGDQYDDAMAKVWKE